MSFSLAPSEAATNPTATDILTKDVRTLDFDFSKFAGTTALTGIGSLLEDAYGNTVVLPDNPAAFGATLSQKIRGSTLTPGSDYRLMVWAVVASGNTEGGLLVVHCVA